MESTQPSASSSSASEVTEAWRGTDSRLTAAEANWEEGESQLRSFLLEQIALLDTTPAVELIISQRWISILSSSITAEQVASLFRSCLEGKEEEEREDVVAKLGESLSDAVEVLMQEKEDSEEDPKKITPRKGEEGMEVDQMEVVSPGDRGMSVIKTLLESDDIPSHIPGLLLAPDRLITLALHPYPHNPAAFQRSFVKRNTSLFFKQSKYNLLREASEGFSNLIVLLTSPESLHPSPLEEEAGSRKDRAKRVWSKILRLIGYFNLSPPRVLDLILEIGSCHVASHWRFWLELLKCSPWGSTAVIEQNSKGKGKGKEVSLDWTANEVGEIGGCMDGDGDRVLAQVLGVKFAFCQRPDSGDTPVGLAYMAALLLKHSFISLPDLLPFVRYYLQARSSGELSPDDTEMESIRKKYLSSATSRSGSSNALMNTVLVDDEPAKSTSDNKDSKDESGPPPKPPPEQRIHLLQALLAIGHMPAALYLLGQFPWLGQYSPSIADLIMRIVARGIEGIYRQTNDVWVESDVSVEDLGLSEVNIKYRIPEREVVPTMLVPSPPPTPTAEFIFFYPDWTNEVDEWISVGDVREKGLRWLSLVRGLGARDVETVVKICRIGAAHFKQLRSQKASASGVPELSKDRRIIASLQPTEVEIQPWLELIRISILPALSASNVTAAFDTEVWQLLQYLPYSTRFALYGEWRDSTCKFGGRNPCNVAAHAFADSTREVKKALSRVTAAQTAPAGGTGGLPDRGPARALAKLSHSNPCALWQTAVSQVRSYSNIGQFIVEAGRYMTQLSYDVATFTLVDVLSDDTASRLNPQGSGVAAWLENLATFVGDFNRRYAAMDLEPVLQFIINRLMRGQSADLTILQSLISIMSGESKIDNDAISNDQLKAYASGREMIREAFNQTVINIARPPAAGEAGLPAKLAPVDKGKSTKKSLPRLLNGLRDTGLAMPIWIALGQTRQGAVDKMVGAPIKAMAAMQDNCHDIFFQYGDLLTEQLSSAEHVTLAPDLKTLVSDFGLEFPQAFQMLRARLNAEFENGKIAEKAAIAAKLEAEKQTLQLKNGDSPPKEPVSLPASPKADVMQVDGEEEASSDRESEAPGSPISTTHSASVPLPKLIASRRQWWPSALTTTMQQAAALLPKDVNEIMSPAFFVIFWHLTMSDIAFSDESYKTAIGKISALEKDVANWRGVNPKDQKDERTRLKARHDILVTERDVQSSLVNTVNRRRLRQESPKWFGPSIVTNGWKSRLSAQLFQHCFYPRAILSPSDAVFVPRFIRLMHDFGTQGFATITSYSHFFNQNLAACIFSCTENEARNLGRCLAIMMHDLDKWHGDEKVYAKEALGFKESDKNDEKAGNEDEPQKGLPGMLIRPKNQGQERHMPWTIFKNFYANKFHGPLMEALISCWAESDFMHIKNAVTVALQVLPSFPIIIPHGQAVEEAMEKLIERGKAGELTPDVLHQCQAYLRQLTMRQKTKPYLDPPDFYPSGKSTIIPPPVEAKPDAPAVPSSETVQSEANGSVTPPVKAETPSITTVDPKVLRAKLEESKALRNAASAAVKDESKATPAPESSSRPPAPARSASTTIVDTEKAAAPPPAGPRVTRSSVSVPPSAPSGPAHAPPTGPSKTSNTTGPTRSQNGSMSMGPPASLTVDEERAAARARKFGTLSKATPTAPPPTPVETPAPTANSSTPLEATTSTSAIKDAPSPNPNSRRGSPAPKSGGRSRSIESRTSERSRRDDGRDTRDNRDNRDRRERDNGGRSRTPSAKGGDDSERERRRQEDLLQARHERLAVNDDKPRRPSRDSTRRGETDKERDERKAKEKERDRDRDRSDRDKERERDGRDGRDRDRDRDRERRSDREKNDRDREKERDKDRTRNEDPNGPKRKREEEPPRRIDPIGRRDDRDPRDVRDVREFDRDRRDTRRDDRHDDRRDPRDFRGDPRDERSSRRDGPPQNRDSRDLPPSNIRPRSPERRERSRPPHEANNGDRTPKRETRSTNSAIELFPPSAVSTSDIERINDQPPKSTSSQNHALPARPSNNGSGPSTSNLPPRTSSLPQSTAENSPPITNTSPKVVSYALPARPAASTAAANVNGRGASAAPASSLAARMGPAPSATPASPELVDDRRPSRGDRDDRGERKRNIEETGPPSREQSPGGSKRIRIDRDKVRRDRGGPRMLASAMRSANDEKPQ